MSMEFLPLNIFYIRVEVPDPDPGFLAWDSCPPQLQISGDLFWGSWFVEVGAAHIAQSGSCNREEVKFRYQMEQRDGCGWERVD